MAFTCYSKYFQTGAKTIVGPTKNRKYKAQPAESLGISAVIGHKADDKTKKVYNYLSYFVYNQVLI